MEDLDWRSLSSGPLRRAWPSRLGRCSHRHLLPGPGHQRRVHKQGSRRQKSPEQKSRNCSVKQCVHLPHSPALPESSPKPPLDLSPGPGSRSVFIEPGSSNLAHSFRPTISSIRPNSKSTSLDTVISQFCLPPGSLRAGPAVGSGTGGRTWGECSPVCITPVLQACGYRPSRRYAGMGRRRGVPVSSHSRRGSRTPPRVALIVGNQPEFRPGRLPGNITAKPGACWGPRLGWVWGCWRLRASRRAAPGRLRQLRALRPRPG